MEESARAAKASVSKIVFCPRATAFLISDKTRPIRRPPRPRALPNSRTVAVKPDLARSHIGPTPLGFNLEASARLSRAISCRPGGAGGEEQSGERPTGGGREATKVRICSPSAPLLQNGTCGQCTVTEAAGPTKGSSSTFAKRRRGRSVYLGLWKDRGIVPNRR
jgi:hypothetical protein